MSSKSANAETLEQRMKALDRIGGSMPWFKGTEKQYYKVKVFKSGNSLAVRVPSGTKLTAGMEMDLLIENGQSLSYDPVGQPKRKFNIAKVAGSAKSLRYIEPESRVFDSRPSMLDKAD